MVSGFQGFDSATQVIDLFLDRGNGRRLLIPHDGSDAWPADDDALLAKHLKSATRGRVCHAVLRRQCSDSGKAIPHLILACGDRLAKLLRQLKVARPRVVEVKRHQISLEVLGHLGQLLVSVAVVCSSCPSTPRTHDRGGVSGRSS